MKKRIIEDIADRKKDSWNKYWLRRYGSLRGFKIRPGGKSGRYSTPNCSLQTRRWYEEEISDYDREMETFAPQLEGPKSTTTGKCKLSELNQSITRVSLDFQISFVPDNHSDQVRQSDRHTREYR